MTDIAYYFQYFLIHCYFCFIFSIFIVSCYSDHKLLFYHFNVYFYFFFLSASLGEHRVRELNDEINKLNKTKSYWDSRIIELGGGDQSKGRKFFDVEGSLISFLFIFFSLHLLRSYLSQFIFFLFLFFLFLFFSFFFSFLLFTFYIFYISLFFIFNFQFNFLLNFFSHCLFLMILFFNSFIFPILYFR